MSKYQEIELNNLETYSIKNRFSKVDLSQFAQKGPVDTSALLNSLPHMLSAKEIKELVAACRLAKSRGRAIILGLGGHVIKCGLGPLIIELMEEGYLSAIAVNGSVIIHDYEIAFYGNTSEDVSQALETGSFGLAFETCYNINNCINHGSKHGLGLGEAIGQEILRKAPNSGLSLLGMAYKYDVPVTVHVAIGTDIIHQTPCANGKAIGDCSLRDFRILSRCMKDLNDGGVYLNFGSAVILPEVFLKALNLARNIYGEVKNFSSAVFDMNQHYRARVNVMQRPVASGGKGYYFIGQHEILIPLLIKSILFS